MAVAIRWVEVVSCAAKIRLNSDNSIGYNGKILTSSLLLQSNSKPDWLNQ